MFVRIGGRFSIRRGRIEIPKSVRKQGSRTLSILSIRDRLKRGALGSLIEPINPIVRGWVNYFAVGHLAQMLRACQKTGRKEKPRQAPGAIPRPYLLDVVTVTLRFDPTPVIPSTAGKVIPAPILTAAREPAPSAIHRLRSIGSDRPEMFDVLAGRCYFRHRVLQDPFQDWFSPVPGKPNHSPTVL